MINAKCKMTGLTKPNGYNNNKCSGLRSRCFSTKGFDLGRKNMLDFQKTGGLVPAIVQDDDTGQVLMLAYMNEEAWDKTLSSGKAHYWSRSRQKLWLKGGTSGHIQEVRAVYVDCDQDTVLLKVHQVGGAACHEGYGSCFYRKVEDGELITTATRVFDPKEVYK